MQTHHQTHQTTISNNNNTSQTLANTFRVNIFHVCALLPKSKREKEKKNKKRTMFLLMHAHSLRLWLFTLSPVTTKLIDITVIKAVHTAPRAKSQTKSAIHSRIGDQQQISVSLWLNTLKGITVFFSVFVRFGSHQCSFALSLWPDRSCWVFSSTLWYWLCVCVCLCKCVDTTQST